MKINIVGNAFSQDGFGVHTQNLTKCLIDEGYDVALESYRPDGWEAMCPKWMYKALQKNNKEEINILIGQPTFANYIMSDKPKGIIQFLIWEGDRLPGRFTKVLNDKRINQVWVASDDTKQTAIKSGVDESKIFIVSHGVNCELFQPDKFTENSPIDKKDTSFKFFYNKGWSKGVEDRGGVAELLKAFSEEFSKDEPVKLVVKINPVYNAQGWDLQAEIDKLGIKSKNNIQIICDYISDEHIVNLYNICDCFVAPTKGEAFGLNIAEALACDMQVIASDRGGHLDFCSKEMCCIKTELLNSPDVPTYEGIKWNYPRLDSIQKEMRRVFEEHKTPVDGPCYRDCIKDKFEWKNTAEKAKKALGKLKLD